jgi:prolyl 4-hydroxylase
MVTQCEREDSDGATPTGSTKLLKRDTHTIPQPTPPQVIPTRHDREAMPTPVPMRFPDAPMLWVVDDIFTPDECTAEIAWIRASVPRLATNNPLYRDQDRVMRDDPATAARLLERLRPHLPETIGGLQLHSVNARLRGYRYRPGQRFSMHKDHWYQPDATRISLLSVVLYLNNDFEGGETRFEEPTEQIITPQPGRAAVFQHKLDHEGCLVHTGEKFAVRTDIMYEAPDKIALTRQYVSTSP